MPSHRYRRATRATRQPAIRPRSADGASRLTVGADRAPSSLTVYTAATLSRRDRHALPVSCGVVLSCLLHLLLLMVAAQHSMPQESPAQIAVTVLEAAPPPPPPAAPAAAPVVAQAQPQPVQVPQPVEQPSRQKPHDRPKPKIARQPPKPRAEEPLPLPIAAPPPVAASAAPPNPVGGVQGGVIGGEEGGKVGGVVGGQGDKLFRVDQVATVPVPISQELPDYPPLARARGVEGLVVVEAVIDRHGMVERDDMHVVQSIPALDQAAVSALGQWRFRPGRDRNGDAVRVLVQVPIRFRLR